MVTVSSEYLRCEEESRGERRYGGGLDGMMLTRRQVSTTVSGCGGAAYVTSRLIAAGQIQPKDLKPLKISVTQRHGQTGPCTRGKDVQRFLGALGAPRTR